MKREVFNIVEAEGERCCGNCKHFLHEDWNGFGLCVAYSHDYESHCSYVCVKDCRYETRRK